MNNNVCFLSGGLKAKELTVREAKGRGQLGLVRGRDPLPAGLVVGEAVLPRERGIPVGVAREGALGQNPVRVGHGGVPIGPQLDPGVAHAQVEGARGGADALLLEEALDAVDEGLVPVGLLRLGRAAGIGAPLALFAGLAGAARAGAGAAARGSDLDRLHLAVVVVAYFELHLPVLVLRSNRDDRRRRRVSWNAI